MAGRQGAKKSYLCQGKIGEHSSLDLNAKVEEIMQEGINKIINSKSKTFFAFCFCFIAGVGTFSFTENPNVAFYIYIFLFAVLFFLILSWHEKIYRFCLLCCLFFTMGALRFCLNLPSISPQNINYYNGTKMEITGYVASEPDIGISDAKYIIKIKQCGDGTIVCPKNISGKVLMATPLYPQYQYGDELKIKCALQDPKNSLDGTFNYKNYLADRGVRSICSGPAVLSAVSGSDGSVLMKKILWFKTIVGGRLNKLWPEPNSSLMAGLLYGSKSTLPKEISDNFNRTGVSHIIAVSGFNVSVIVSFLLSILIFSGLYRRAGFLGGGFRDSFVRIF
jgi:hypothetical protein